MAGTIEKFNEQVGRIEDLIAAVKAMGFGEGDVTFEGETKASLQKRFQEILDAAEFDFEAATELLADMSDLRDESANALALAISARDAALLSRGLWQTTAQGIGQGVAGVASLVAGSGGTNGTFQIAFSGGTQVFEPRGYFVVAGGVVTQVVITYAGYYSAGVPSLSFAASAGLTGASATAVMGANTPVDAYFSVPVAGSNDSLILYKVTAGPVASEITRYPSTALVASNASRVGAIEQSTTLGVTTGKATAGDVFALPATPVGYKKIVINGVVYAFPYYGFVAPIDLFIVVGQSNAEGRGSSGSSPAAPNGRYVASGVITNPLADPVGGALTGSMWPEWSNEWFTQTGTLSAFVEQATGGTALIPNAAGSNWSPSGTLRAAAVTAANDAISTLNASPEYWVRSVYFVWGQGEQEAETINGTTITGALYEQALKDLADYFKAQVPSMSKMLVVRTGSRNDRANASGWAEIRTAQENACAVNANLRMAYRGTYSFSADALGYMSDAVHDNQPGLNLAGKCAARESSKVTPTAEPAAPVLIGSPATYMDTDQAALATSRTVSHTTGAGTKLLVVAVGISRIVSNTTNAILSVTFNGVPLNKFASSAGANASPQGRSDVAIYYINESAYGSSLGGVTADIVATWTQNTNITSLAAYDANAEGVPSISRAKVINVATGTDLTITLTTADNSFLVGVVAACGDGAAAHTFTWSGLTEDADAGDSNGTRAGEVSFAHAAVGVAVDTLVGATVSATVNGAACLVAAFRGVIDGE